MPTATSRPHRAICQWRTWSPAALATFDRVVDAAYHAAAALHRAAPLEVRVARGACVVSIFALEGRRAVNCS